MEGTTSVAHKLNVVPRTDDIRLKEMAPFCKMLIKESVRKGLTQAGFVYPTVIQATAIPMGKSGVDLLVQSKSGTGKTLIFASVILDAYKKDVVEPQSLVVAPAREIAVQITENLNKIGKFCLNFKAVSVIGGMDVMDDRKRLQGAKAIVGTPGRILHLIENNVLNTAHLRIFVLDEADKMMSKSFRQDIKKILSFLPSRKQIIACSATFENKLDEELAKFMKNPLLVSTEERATMLLGIKQFVYLLPEQKTSILEMQLKLDAIRHIFGKVSFKQCIIFAGSQSRAESYCNYLEKDGWPCELISGAQDQRKRLEQFRKFREFKTRILITTDLMSRGIDSEHVNLVINLELPVDSVTYLHRIGRAGRFGSHGVAISFVSSQKDEKQFQLLLSEVGTGMKALNFPNKKCDNTERDIWNFDSPEEDVKHFGAFPLSSKVMAPLASQESITLTPSLSEMNKGNLKNNNTSGQQHSSINTNTFLIHSNDSALKVPKLQCNTSQLSPKSCKKHDLISTVITESDNATTTPCESYDLSNQLMTSNTIDDASSIAADSLLSSQQDESKYLSVLMQKSSIPTLVEFLVDNESQTKQNQDLFDTYTEEVLNDDNDLTEQEVTVDGPILTPSKLAQFKSMLIDRPQEKCSDKTNIDLYSDFAQFKEDDPSTTASHDKAKETFILSVSTPPIRPDLEELNNNSSDLYPATDETNITSKSNEVYKYTKHFPSPAHKEGQNILGLAANVLHQENKHKQQQQNPKLSINVAAHIEIPPQQYSSNSTSSKRNSEQFHDGDSASASESLNSMARIDSESNEVLESGTESAEGGNSSGFDEKTSTSGSSGIVTSEDEINILQQHMDQYETSSEEEEDYDNYTSSSEEEQKEDTSSSEENYFYTEDENEDTVSNRYCERSPEHSASKTSESSRNLTYQTATSKWFELYWSQINAIQDYVKFVTSARK